jgi:uncharacterized protein with von Willebrand factor type A (vWA) domain
MKISNDDDELFPDDDELFPDDDDQADDQADDSAETHASARPIRNGSQVLLHDGYDVAEFAEAASTFSRLAQTVERERERLITSLALFRDLFWSFNKRAPEIKPVAPLTPAYAVNQAIIEQIMSTVEWEQVRQTGTVGDLLNSAMATIGAAEKVLNALSREQVEEINRLYESETGADELFAQAEALEDLASQAKGDRAERLYEQARQAQAEAKQKEAEAERIAKEIAGEIEEIEDKTRRAARAGLEEAGKLILAAGEAVKSFTGGHAGANGLSVKDKIAIATQVGKSKKLKQIAAICGRFTRIALKVQATRVKHPPDEITSITIGAELGRILPSELALLTDPVLEDLFFLKFTDGRLLNYDLIGQEKKGQGPIIVALDSSGSMDGEREIWSKAVTLAIMAIARLQKRDMAVMHFSSQGELKVWHFAKGQGSYSAVMNCAEFFYGGGTQYEQWMAAAIALIDRAEYNQADTIIVSDGEASVNPQALAEWQARRQQRGMRCYSVLIGTRSGAEVLSTLSDALLLLDNLAEDNQVLQTIFSI